LLSLTGIGVIVTNALLACRSSTDEHIAEVNSVINYKDKEDAWEGTFWETENPFPVHALLQIKYRDGNGQDTERVVTVRQFDNHYLGGMIIGHCHLRNATRTFRFDRIIECFDRKTGEFITDVGFFLQKIYESSPSFSIDKLLETDYDTVRVLLYVGRADGQLRKPEKQIILDVCRQLTSDTRINDVIFDKMILDIENLTINAFKKAVNRLSTRSNEEKDIILNKSIEIINTQKTKTAAEQEAIEYIKKSFSRF